MRHNAGHSNADLHTYLRSLADKLERRSKGWLGRVLKMLKFSL